MTSEAFRSVGGFDAAQFPHPSIEDIDLGMRLRRAGHQIRLEKTLQVTHLKAWTWVGVLNTDIRRRAYPWARIIIAAGSTPDDLNLRLAHRVSAVLVALLVAMIPFLWLGHKRFYGVPVAPLAVLVSLVSLGNLVLLNRDFYLFLLRHRGWVFMTAVIPAHLLYYLYAGMTFVWCWLLYQFGRPFRRTRGTA